MRLVVQRNGRQREFLLQSSMVCSKVDINKNYCEEIHTSDLKPRCSFVWAQHHSPGFLALLTA